jgi:hypothetical protein
VGLVNSISPETIISEQSSRLLAYNLMGTLDY